MNDKYIAQAATQEEAITKGLNALSISREEAKITIDEPGKKGFLGFGQKDAVVVVERKEKVNIVDEFLSNEFDMDRKSQTTTEQKQEDLEEAAFPEEEHEKPLVDEDPKKVEAKKQEEAATKEEILEGRDHTEVEIMSEDKEDDQEDNSYDFDADEDADDDYEEKDSSELTEEDIHQIDQVAIEEVRQYLNDIIITMGVEDAEVYTSRVRNNVKYDIETQNAGLVIGRHGKVLNGLQTLAQNHMHQLAHSKINVRADAEKYRERRRNTVESLANRTADKVIKTNRRVKLDPMPAHERKQIHRYLNQNPKVKTHSEGREPKRYLVVEPADE